MKERRRFPRFNRAELTVDVARPGIAGFLKLNPCTECMNFSLTGIQFGSDQAFEIGEKLVLDLSIYDVALREIPAVVVKSRLEDGHSWCTGVRFCFDSKRMQSARIRHRLLKIENNLRQAEEYPLLAT
ncbi:MAG: PilZ domain-containing protein [Pseudomonadales bacterium]|nr:PilZ domain-containing protein [Pseudomonadales bacterium]